MHHLENNKSAKTKIIKFSLNNQTGSALHIQADEKNVLIEAGKVAEMAFANGIPLIVPNGTAVLRPGVVLAIVSDALKGNTLVVR